MSSSPAILQRLCSGKPILIDGGLATQCEAMGYDIGGAMWSAELLRSSPHAILDAHRAFLDVGAEIIITASYQASRKGLMAGGLSLEQADELIVRSVLLAAQARDEFLRDNSGAKTPFIAASIGPYGAALNDGSEYTGQYGISTQALREFHSDRLKLLANSGADLLACETIPSFEEAQVLSELLRVVRLPAWVCFTCMDERHISDGTPIAEAIGLFAKHDVVFAVGANCVSPQLIPAIIGELKKAVPDKAFVVYPNSGETYSAEDQRWSGAESGVEYAKLAQQWIDAGAQLVGGCCRIGSSQISEMAQCGTLVGQ